MRRLLFFLLPMMAYGSFASFKPAYYLSQDKECRHIYNGGFMPLGEVGFYFNKHLFMSIEGGYFHKRSTVTSFDVIAPTTVTIVPVSLFLGCSWPVRNYCDLYLKAGPDLIYARTWVDIPDLTPVTKKLAAGASFSCGSKFYLWRGLFIELFFEYLYNSKDIEGLFHAYLGGYVAGGGIGYKF